MGIEELEGGFRHMAARFHHIEHFKGGRFHRTIALRREACADARCKVFAHQSLVAHHIAETNRGDVVHVPSFL